MVNIVCGIEAKDLLTDEVCFIRESFSVEGGTIKETSVDISTILKAYNNSEINNGFYAYDVFFAMEVESGKVLFDNTDGED